MNRQFAQTLTSLFLLTLLTQSSLAQPDPWMMNGGQNKAQEVELTQPESPPQPSDAVVEQSPVQKPASEPSAAEKPVTEPSAAEKPPADEDKTATESPADATLELARKAQNPISSMVSVPFQYNSYFGVGPNDDTTQLLNIQPVVPVPLSEDLTLVNRAIIPISYVPNSAVPVTLASGAELGLGDTNYQMFFVPTTKPGKLIWGVGPTFTLPTATADKLGTGKWLAGANAVALTMKGPWVVGGLVSQQWSVAGKSSRPDVSFLTLQPFINRNYKGGWYATTSPIISANWKADSDDRWTVPIGGGFGRIFSMGEQKVNVSLQGYGNVVKPTNGPDWSLRFQFTLLFPGS